MKTLKEYIITWPNGDKEKVKGKTIFNAMVRSGYGHIKVGEFNWQRA